MGAKDFAYHLRFQLAKTLKDWNIFLDTWKKNRGVGKIFRDTDPYPDSASLGLPSLSVPWSQSAYVADWLKARKKLILALSLGLPGIALLVWFAGNLPNEISLSALTPAPQVEMPSPEPVNKPEPMQDSATATSESKPPEKTAEIKIPNNIPLLVASKKRGEMFLYQFKNKEWKLVKSWPMLYGANEGNKQVEGDKKTPEGNYWITQIYPGPRVGELYGSLIFTLNFPNEKDLAAGKTGDGIWIHGNPFGKPMERTKGCLKLSNADMLDLFPHVNRATPVVVLSNTDSRTHPSEFDLAWVPKDYPERLKIKAEPYNENSKLLSLEEIRIIAKRFVESEEKLFAFREKNTLPPEEVDKIMARIEKWRSSWASKDMAGYQENFHPEFKGKNGRNLKEFVERKKIIVNNLDSLNVEVSNIQIIPQNDSFFVVEFDQSYRAYRGGEITLAADSQKELILNKKDNKWLIAKE